MKRLAAFLILACFFAGVPSAHAYLGPGLGMGVIGVIIGIISSIFLAVFAVVWYPIKRLLKRRKKASADVAEQ